MYNNSLEMGGWGGERQMVVILKSMYFKGEASL